MKKRWELRLAELSADLRARRRAARHGDDYWASAKRCRAPTAPSAEPVRKILADDRTAELLAKAEAAMRALGDAMAGIRTGVAKLDGQDIAAIRERIAKAAADPRWHPHPAGDALAKSDPPKPRAKVLH